MEIQITATPLENELCEWLSALGTFVLGWQECEQVYLHPDQDDIALNGVKKYTQCAECGHWLEIISEPTNLRDIPVQVNLVFDDWVQQGKSVYRTEEGIELSKGDFHSGTIFKGSITLDREHKEELKIAIKNGYNPVFRLFLEK